MTTNSSRREFLKEAAFLLASLCGSMAEGGSHNLIAEARSGYKIGPWTGDDFTVGHELRDGKIPKFPKTATEKADFVIVGGGIAGLSSAYFLRDSKFLLLEQYETLGGHARGGSFQGIDYSYGSAYLATVEGAIGELLSDLALKPIKLDDSKFAWFNDGSWLRGYEGTADNVIYKEFKRFQSEHQSFWNKWNGLYPQIQELPELLKLDDVLMEETLKSYDPKFVALLDGFLKSGLNGGVKSVSALSGLSTMEDVFGPTHVLPGGNPALTREITKRLKESHGESVKTGSFVWDIRLKDNGASVTYGMNDGSLHMVDCRHVIFAIPQMVAARVARNLPDKAKAAMFRFRYGSYAVANILMKKKVIEGSYDNYLPAPYEIGDITLAETPYMLNGTYKPEMGSVLTLYVPYEAASPGRTLLYQGNKKKLAAELMAELTKLFPAVKDNVEEVVLSRWGHALAVAKPQYFKYIGELLKFENDSLSFAHSSAHGLPGAEAAVQGALHASQRAKAVKLSAKPIYSTGSVPSTALAQNRIISRNSKVTAALVQFIAILSLMLSMVAPGHASKATTIGASAKTAATNPTYWPPRLNNYYPDMELINQDGKLVRLSNFRGRVVVVEPIGMSCAGCQAFAGANRPGMRPYGGGTAQAGLKSFEEYLSEYAGTTLQRSQIVFVQLLLYDPALKLPTAKDAQQWAQHFGMRTADNKYVLVARSNMIGQASYNMIPGFQLIDKGFVLRSDATGHSPQNDLYSHFFPTLKRLL